VKDGFRGAATAAGSWARTDATMVAKRVNNIFACSRWIKKNFGCSRRTAGRVGGGGMSVERFLGL
jgi:hypothetical protein